MMEVVLTAFKYILRAIYLPMKLFIRTDKKIVWLSRQSNEKSLDMQLLSRAIEREMPEYKQVFRLKMLDPGLIPAVKYFFWILGDMVQLAGTSVAICDTYSIPVSCLNHKKSLKVIQMWHAAGAVKKFGLQSLGKAEGRDERVSRILQMHEHYDYVLAPSEHMAVFYEEAFGVTREQIVLLTLPRIDYLLCGPDKRETFLRQNPDCQGKRLVLYLPTFREDEEIFTRDLETAFADAKDVKLLVSPHPLSKVKAQTKSRYNGEFRVEDLMRMADVILTDYSACIFEAAVLGGAFGKKVYLYVPDYEEYQQKRGLNIDLKKELPGYTFEDPQALYEAIMDEKYDDEDLKKFREEYINDTENCTKKAAGLVCRIMQE